MYNSHYAMNARSGVAAMSVLMMLGLIIFFLIIMVIGYVYTGITLGRVFKKAGIPSSAAWVPFYNSWKLFEMGSFHGALSLLVLIPYAGSLAYMILFFISAYRIGLKFGKSSEFVLLAIFVSPVWMGILAFGKAQWGVLNTAAYTNPVAPVQPQQPVNHQQ